MRDYHETPESVNHGLFLIRKKSNLNHELMQKLHEFALKNGRIISLERVFKGEEDALLIYGPISLLEFLPELDLLEVEDLLDEKISINYVFAWAISPKKGAVQKTADIKRVTFWKELGLDSDQMLFWQIVLKPEGNMYQVTVRGMIVDSDPAKRVTISKLIDEKLNMETGMVREDRSESTTDIFNAYKKRAAKPKEAAKFILKGSEVLNLLGV